MGKTKEGIPDLCLERQAGVRQGAGKTLQAEGNKYKGGEVEENVVLGESTAN